MVSLACFLAISLPLVSAVSAQTGCTFRPRLCNGFFPFRPVKCCNNVCTDVRYDPMNCGFCHFRCTGNTPQCVSGMCQAAPLSPPPSGGCPPSPSSSSPPPPPTTSPIEPPPPTTSPIEPPPPLPSLPPSLSPSPPPSPSQTPPSKPYLSPSPCPNPPVDCTHNLGICGSNKCCFNQCVDLTSDPNNCGICGVRCLRRRTCCSGRCTNLRFDPYNCGGCFNVCKHRQICFLGRCLGDSR